MIYIYVILIYRLPCLPIARGYVAYGLYKGLPKGL